MSFIPSLMRRKTRKILRILTLVLAIVIYNSIDTISNELTRPPVSDDRRIPSVQSARVYRILSERDVSTASRTKKELTIFSHSANRDERAHTVMQAALDAQQLSGSHFVSVHLVPSPDLAGSLMHSLASADYSPDGRGLNGEEGCRWYVLSGDLHLSPGEIALLEKFETQKWTDRRGGGFPETRSIVRAVAREMKLPTEEVERTLNRTGERIELARTISFMECDAGRRWLEDRKITGTHVGCRNPETHQRLARSAADPATFRRVLDAEEARGECVIFEEGEDVFITDRSRLLSGLVKVVRSGDDADFWVLVNMTHL